jgi:hypothetical protein
VDGESPRTFTNLIRKAFDAGLSSGELSKLLFVKESDLAELMRDAESPTWATDGVRMRLAR